MFTGIIEESGTVQTVRKTPSGIRLAVKTRKTHQGTKPGSSLSVDGVCLTVVQKKGKTLSFDVSRKSLFLTTLGLLKPKARVNLERPLKWGSRVGGHLVQGHVDGVGLIQSRKKEGKNVLLKIRSPRSILNHLIPRGSIAVDGVSLTITHVNRGSFSLYLVPHTLKVTGLKEKGRGDKVNLEADLLVKIVRSNPEQIKRK